MAGTQQTTTSEAPWHAKYPAPKYAPGEISREEVLAMLKDPSQVAGRDFVLVDVRRNDFEGGTIRGSVNFPAQSLYPTRPAIFQMVKAAGIKQVIFYCGSCNGRGPRAAGWFGDYLAEQEYQGAQSMILTGGIKGWAKAGQEYVGLMDEFEASVWS
ncbi:Rhodanese-like protein [Sarocladium strictum]